MVWQAGKQPRSDSRPLIPQPEGLIRGEDMAHVIQLRIRRWEDHSGLSRRLQCLTRRQEAEGGDGVMEAGIGWMRSDDGGQDREPGHADGLSRLEKMRRHPLLEAPEAAQPLRPVSDF